MTCGKHQTRHVSTACRVPKTYANEFRTYSNGARFKRCGRDTEATSTAAPDADRDEVRALVMTSRAWRRLAVLFVAVPSLVVLAVPATPRADRVSPARCVERLNHARVQVGVAPVRHSATLEEAAQRHADYRAWADERGLRDGDAHLERRGDWRDGTFRPRRHFSGERPWDRTRAAGLRPGTWARQGENVLTSTTGGRRSAAAVAGVAVWLQAPYHRLPMLDANLRLVGCAASRPGVARGHRAQVLQMVWPRDAPRRRTVGVYPAPGQTGVPTGFNRRTETPRPFARVPLPGDPAADVGPVVTIQASGSTALRVAAGSGLRRVEPDRGRVPVHWGLPGSDRHLPDNAAMLAATAPLRPDATYEVRIVARVRHDGHWRPLTRTWQFTTRGED